MAESFVKTEGEVQMDGLKKWGREIATCPCLLQSLGLEKGQGKTKRERGRERWLVFEGVQE